MAVVILAACTGRCLVGSLLVGQAATTMVITSVEGPLRSIRILILRRDLTLPRGNFFLIHLDFHERIPL